MKKKKILTCFYFCMNIYQKYFVCVCVSSYLIKIDTYEIFSYSIVIFRCCRMKNSSHPSSYTCGRVNNMKLLYVIESWIYFHVFFLSSKFKNFVPLTKFKLDGSRNEFYDKLTMDYFLIQTTVSLVID